jgi:serine/alanine adding enzyme
VLWDASSPEFTGPLMCGNTSGVSGDFQQRCSEKFRSEGIVTEFGHLHPWEDNHCLMEPDGIKFNREIIWVDVSVPPEELWRTHFEHACRKNINRAQREGVRVTCVTSDEHIREFHRIYFQTMDRNQALSSYYFPLEYFLMLRDELGEQARFVLAEHKGRIVAATLYMNDGVDVFSYLGGADAECQQVRPTNAVIFETIKWAHETGKKRLILGGGYKPDDGIFRFKATFSKYKQPFNIYKHVHMHPEYDNLRTQWAKYYGQAGIESGYFPIYRHVPQPLDQS